MTANSHIAGSEQPLPSACARMRELGLQHVPVVRDGKLCGVLSEQEVARLEASPSTELACLSVVAAMGQEPYLVAPSTPLLHVVRAMATHGYSCAVVLERGAVLGVFAVVDALRALTGFLLEAEAIDQEETDASQVRAVILSEHAHVHTLLSRTQTGVHRLRSSGATEREARQVRRQADRLRDAIQAYFELQEQKLAPVLAELTGSSKSIGQQLTEEHIRQVSDMATLAAVLEVPALPPSSLADQLEQLLSNLRRDLEREHALLLSLDAASNDQIITDAAAD
ncbi:MAG TPA: CBS domain-containing protein [Polyangiales bacterium]